MPESPAIEVDGYGMSGYVAPGFESVADEFARNLSERDELGAAFAATRDGEVVVDLWGGASDARTQQPWREETAVVIFSGTKGLTALCLMMLVDRGLLDLEKPVADYWPEFAAAGKDAITVQDIAAHRGRLPGIRKRLTETDILQPARMSELLAKQQPEHDPRAALAYHPLTYGWLCAELILRVDGRSVGQFFAEEIASPLGLDIWIGLPPDLESRVATLRYADNWGLRAQNGAVPPGADDLMDCVWSNPPLFPHDHIPWNRADFHAAEIPAAGGIATARSLARLYGCLACGGRVDELQLLSERTLARARKEVSRRWEPLVDEPIAFGVGFQLQTEWSRFGPVGDAFGHTGAGGSSHCAWPSLGVGVSYAMNKLRDDCNTDPRGGALFQALHRSLLAVA